MQQLLQFCAQTKNVSNVFRISGRELVKFTLIKTKIEKLAQVPLAVWSCGHFKGSLSKIGWEMDIEIDFEKNIVSFCKNQNSYDMKSWCNFSIS